MASARYIISVVEELVKKYGTRDPYELCACLGIHIKKDDLDKKLKGYYYYKVRRQTIVIDSNLNEILERILVAHELGHAVLHKDIAMMVGFYEMEVFDSSAVFENDANLFSAELLLLDEDVMELLRDYSFFQTAQILNVPAALLDYKFRLMCEKGLLKTTMEYRRSDYLKEDLGAYDPDDMTW